MKESDFLFHELALVVEIGARLLAQNERALGKPADPQPDQEVDPRRVDARGNRDPIGFLLGDAYWPYMEEFRIRELIYRYPDLSYRLCFDEDMTEEQREEHTKRLEWLEKVHDLAGPMTWDAALVREALLLASRILLARTAEIAGIDDAARFETSQPFAVHVRW